jgi:hypothetical protein
MTSPYCGFTKRLIVLSICLCGLLAFSTTLSANTTFVVGQDNLGSYTPNNGSGTAEGVSEPVGPYAGVLTINGTVQPNYLFFCLTGNQYLDTTETGSVGSPTTSALVTSNVATTQQLEEAAFLASYTLTEAAQDQIILNSTDGATITFSPSASTGQFISSVLGPIQDAIWYVMGTLPAGDSNILNDPVISGLVTLAQTSYLNYSYNNVQVFTFVPTKDQPTGQSFISVDTLPSVPEPGTMVLFGGGALLMGLGCMRRRMARRPR